MKALLNLFSEIEEPKTEKAAKSRVWELFTSDLPAEPEKPPKPVQTTFPIIEGFFFWAMEHLPIKEAVKHLMTCGIPGSGKTVTILLFLISIIDRFRIGRKEPEQLIIFDAKLDMVPQLASLGFPPELPNVYIINPFDERGATWNCAEAAQEPAQARHLAGLLVPEEKNSTAPYFSEAARELTYAAILALNYRHGTDWTLRDLLCALTSRENIAAVTMHHGRANELADRILRDEKHSDGVISTLGNKLGKFEQVAALWATSRSKKTFSIEKFLSEPGILVLGNDPVLKDSIWPINAALLKALTDEILRRGNHGKPRYWFVLDEFRAMQKVDCIHDLLNRGRSKGASVLIGAQSIEGLIENYGDPGANDLLAQCAHKTFLRAGSGKTAEWIEQYFGKYRQVEASYSESSGSSGPSHSTSYALKDRPFFLASTFANLPLPNEGGPYIAISDVPSLGQTVISHRNFDELLGWLKPPSNIPASIHRSSIDEQTLWPWTAEERRHFCAVLPPKDLKTGETPSPTQTYLPLRPKKEATPPVESTSEPKLTGKPKPKNQK